MATRLGHKIERFSAPYEALLELIECMKTLNQLRSAIIAEPNQVPALDAKILVGNDMLEPQLRTRVTTLLNTIAQITCVDGATIVDEYFEPLLFGARLSADQWRGKVCLATQSGDEIPRGRYGTRHNSAIDFVAACPGVIAFVLSQDGPVRAFERYGEMVRMWPDCLATMFVE